MAVYLNVLSFVLLRTGLFRLYWSSSEYQFPSPLVRACLLDSLCGDLCFPSRVKPLVLFLRDAVLGMHPVTLGWQCLGPGPV